MSSMQLVATQHIKAASIILRGYRSYQGKQRDKIQAMMDIHETAMNMQE